MSEPLSVDQIKELQERLRSQRKQLIDEIRADLMQTNESRLQALAGSVHDSADEAVSTLLVDVDSTIVHQHRHELEDTENALARIVDGIYGECMVCGANIGYERLSVSPAATRCISCQEEYEKTKV